MGGAKILCSGARGPLEHTAKTTRREEQLRSGAYRTVRRSVTVDSQVLGLRFRDAARDAGADTSRGRRDAKYTLRTVRCSCTWPLSELNRSADGGARRISCRPASLAWISCAKSLCSSQGCAADGLE